mgnify:CR=1 FL=1
MSNGIISSMLLVVPTPCQESSLIVQEKKSQAMKSLACFFSIWGYKMGIPRKSKGQDGIVTQKDHFILT